MSLQTLVSLADDVPWCGNVPRHPPRFDPGVIVVPIDPRRAELGPQPQPWNFANVQSVLADSIRMYKLGLQIRGDVGTAMTQAAQKYYDDDGCGNIPLADLLRIILHGPPPPPDPWMEKMTYLANTVVFGQVAGQEQIVATASQQLLAAFKAFQAQA